MKLQLKVLKTTTTGCFENITKAIRTVDATAVVQADPKTKIVLVETQASETSIKAVIIQASYPAS